MSLFLTRYTQIVSGGTGDAERFSVEPCLWRNVWPILESDRRGGISTFAEAVLADDGFPWNNLGATA